MLKDLLPLGSIVILKGGLRKLMIIGIKIAPEEEPKKFYDYIGVLYPEGFIGDEGHFLFNHSDINDIIFTGYSNPEREDFLDFLETNLNNQETDV